MHKFQNAPVVRMRVFRYIAVVGIAVVVIGVIEMIAGNTALGAVMLIAGFAASRSAVWQLIRRRIPSEASSYHHVKALALFGLATAGAAMFVLAVLGDVRNPWAGAVASLITFGSGLYLVVKALRWPRAWQLTQLMPSVQLGSVHGRHIESSDANMAIERSPHSRGGKSHE